MSENDNDKLKPAEENPWYILATIYGEPSSTDFTSSAWCDDAEVNAQKNNSNRKAWNNYFNTKYENKKVIEEISEKFKNRTQLPLPNPNEKIDFSSTHFSKGLNLSGFVLPKIDFTRSVFEDGLSLFDAKFTRDAVFHGIQLKGNNDFYKAYFSEFVVFTHASFAEDRLSRFCFTIFKGGASFHNTKFYQGPLFADCIFEQSCNFDNTQFRGSYPIFTSTVFPKTIALSAKENTKEIIYWPNPKNCEQNPEEAKATCEILRVQMEAQGLHEQAHFFFRREMHFAGKMLPPWHRLPYRLFDWFSDYGHSIFLPSIWLYNFWLASGLIYFGTTKLTFGEAMGLSISNPLQIAGLQRIYWSDVIECLPWGLKILGGAQTLLAIPLLFLLLLGLRNRFRLK